MFPAHKELYEFSNFRLNVAERLLIHNEERVAVPEKVFETLCVLVANAGRLIEKDELMEKVWGETIVEENNLDKKISALRKVLGEVGGDEKFIETVRGHGYRFIAEVRRIKPLEPQMPAAGQKDFGFGISDSGFRDGGETTGDEQTIENRRIKTEGQDSKSKSDVGYLQSNNVVALAEWRNEPESEKQRNENELKSPLKVEQLAAVRPATSLSEMTAPRREKKRDSFGLAIILSVCVLALIGIGYGFYKFGGSNRMTAGSEQRAVEILPANIKIRRLTTESRVYSPAISPDGKYLAYVLRETGEKESVWLKNITNGSVVQIMPSSNSYHSLIFSPDGNYLYFGTRSEDDKNPLIVRIPIFGGARQEIAGNHWGHFALSPDGRYLAFPRGSTKPGETHSLIAVNIETSEERAVVKRGANEENEFYFHFWGATPSWSPDGEKIAICGRWRDETGGWRHTIFEVWASDGTMREIPAPRWAATYQVAWLADGSGLLVVAREKTDSPYQIWHLAYPSGEARRITNDVNDYGTLSLTADSRTLVAQQEFHVSHIWISPDGDTNRARQLTFGINAQDGFYGLAWTPDERIVFDSKRSGSQKLWAISADGGNPQQLTADANDANYSPKVTPDGRYIVFVSQRDGNPNIWRMDIDGHNAVRLTNGASDDPSLSPDGRGVYYTEASVSPSTIAKISIDGGEPVKLTKRFNAYNPVVSPDGKLVAYSHFEDETGWVTGIMPIEGGEPFKLLKLQGIFGAHAWASDSKSLIYIKGGILESNLFRQSIEGDRAPKQITFFKEDRIMSFAYSPDYKQLALTRGNHYSDVVLINNFSKTP
ncbi:MAG TPA: winged helix-turn-helix domain-containing protein [Pyrinomonadaceae bacterium]|nr:winged helix-turn-helix domain-containing protein [Pyrinomonadaceae bacterium]